MGEGGGGVILRKKYTFYNELRDYNFMKETFFEDFMLKISSIIKRAVTSENLSLTSILEISKIFQIP